ncbi:type II secretion system F family protein [Nocardioidaceae bacterium SCSIO 66511]|nr:type II secretion system F family protein [Nocardioidaceae bacterium SCSIO 66511]
MSDYRIALALTAGAVVGLGVALCILAIVGVPRRDVTPRRVRSRKDVERQTKFAVAGVVVFAATLVVTQWLVLAAVFGAVVIFWDRLFGGARVERQAIDRIEGLATWTESLRDTIAGAVGLEQAIPATAVNAAPSIRPALNLLVDRLRVREPLPDALMKFADDLDDPSADLVVASLILNARLRGPGLRSVLSALSESARDELDLRRRVEGSRRSTRRSVLIVVLVIGAMSGFLILFNPSYVEPYDTPQGQLVLAVVLGLYALSIMWLRRLAGVRQPERFLVQSRHQVESEGAGR